MAELTMDDLMFKPGLMKGQRILITGGGIIPKEDMDVLRTRGIGQLFGPGTPTSALIDYIRDWFAEREEQLRQEA